MTITCFQTDLNEYITVEESILGLMYKEYLLYIQIATETNNHEIRIKKLMEHNGVYFIKDGYGMIKIGTSNNILQRCRNHTTSSSHPLEMIAIKLYDGYNVKDDFEQKMHLKYNKYHYKREWFNIPENEICNIISTMNEDEIIACKLINEILKEKDEDKYWEIYISDLQTGRKS